MEGRLQNIGTCLTATIGPDRDAIEIVPNGIDVEQVRTAPRPDQGYDVCFAGRLIEHKNVDVLMEAFDAVAAEHDATLGIIGDGPERERLGAKRDALAHPDRVEFLGFLDDYEDVLGHMRAADIFVSPSTREGFGLTFAEAVAAECTVIAADHPDSAADEVIGEAGFLAEPTVSGVETVLERALDGERPPGDPLVRAKTFDWDRVAEEALAVYQAAATGQ